MPERSANARRRHWLLAAALLLAACTRPEGPPLATVDYVEPARYAGTWYEIARTPNPFQKDCFATRAIYTLRDDGRLGVTNRCREGSLDGPVEEATGTARIVDTSSNARLKVTFFWPFSGDYWIVALDDDYRYAVVGEPKRRYLWILSRTPTLDAQTLAQLRARLPQWGYDPATLVLTPQP